MWPWDRPSGAGSPCWVVSTCAELPHFFYRSAPVAPHRKSESRSEVGSRNSEFRNSHGILEWNRHSQIIFLHKMEKCWKIQNIFQHFEFNRHLFLSTNDNEEGALNVNDSALLWFSFSLRIILNFSMNTWLGWLVVNKIFFYNLDYFIAIFQIIWHIT